MMKKLVLQIFAVFALLGNATKAQTENGYKASDPYRNGIGLRLGTENGITFKHFFKPTVAFEGMVTTGYRALVATALIEKHVPIFDVDGFNLLFGGGAHIGHWKYVAYYRYQPDNGYYYRRYDPMPSAGIDGIFGVEYKIPNAPFTVGADIKPFLDAFYPGDSWIEGAFSFRYAFY